MSKTLTKEDLKLIGQVVEGKIGSLDMKIDAVEERLIESIRGINSNSSQGLSQLRKDMEELLSEHHHDLIESITEVILKDKLQAFETDLQQVKDRLATLEAVQ